MKRCPECRRDYYDDTLLYCLDDGNALLEGPAKAAVGDEPTTAILPIQGMAATFSPAEEATRVLETDKVQIAEPGNSIAVLPFANISNDPENEYFCDGLAEELLNALAKIDDLKVAARTSAFSFRGRNVEINQIARSLGVKTVLEGSVRKSGNQLRITVQLINASDGYHLWSDRYDREMQDIFAIQDEITLAVIDALKVKLLGRGRSTKKTENIAAYELYLKGKYHLAKLTPPDMQKSIEYFQKATQLDESYSKAYAGLADAYMRISIAGELPSKEFFPKSKAAAAKAIEADESLAEAYVALAWIMFWYDWNWNEAERYCRRALELDPGSPDAHVAYAHFLSNTGRHTDALGEISRAKELDPLSLFVGAMEGQFLLHAGLIDDALAALLNLIELEANFWLPHLIASGAYIEKEIFGKAVAEAKRANQLSGGSTQASAFEAHALVAAGQHKDAEILLSETVQLSAIRYVPPYALAQMHYALEDLDNTFKCLERGIDERDVKMVFLKVEPKWNGLRTDPRFGKLLQSVGFPD